MRFIHRLFSILWANSFCGRGWIKDRHCLHFCRIANVIPGPRMICYVLLSSLFSGFFIGIKHPLMVFEITHCFHNEFHLIWDFYVECNFSEQFLMSCIKRRKKNQFLLEMASCLNVAYLRICQYHTLQLHKGSYWWVMQCESRAKILCNSVYSLQHLNATKLCAICL